MTAAMEPTAPQRTERINLRVAPEVDELLREAAGLRHKSLTAFLLDAACDEARATIEEHRRIRVRTETFNRILDELDEPAKVVAPLLDLLRHVDHDADSA